MKREAARRSGSPKKSRRDGESSGPTDVAVIHFTAKLRTPRRASSEVTPETWTFLKLPTGASTELPSRGPVTVEGTLNDHRFTATCEPDGRGGHWLKVDEGLRAAAGAEAGDIVTLKVVPVEKEPEPEVPPDLRRALAAADPSAREVWSDITPVARRDWIRWITSGKKAGTRLIRIGKACDMLAKGKRRPCCFDRSGMYDKSLSCPVADDEADRGESSLGVSP